MTPQWEFLDFVAQEARLYSRFTLIMEAEATGIIRDGGRVTGVTYRSAAGSSELKAKLVIASDGRRSLLRDAAALPVRTFGVPMDVFWFRMPKVRELNNRSTGFFTSGHILAAIDRGDYWQCAYVFRKGEADKVRARGLAAFRNDVAKLAAPLHPQVDAIANWDAVKLLTVALDRLERWHAPGLLVIGDAAHAMSPIGGVGINVAIQDASPLPTSLRSQWPAARVWIHCLRRLKRGGCPP